MIRKAIVASGIVFAALAIVLDGAVTDAQACGGCRSRCNTCYTCYTGCAPRCRPRCCNTCYAAPAPCYSTCYTTYAAPACCVNMYSVPVYANYASRPYYTAPMYAAPVAAHAPRSVAVPVSYVGTRTVYAR